MQPRIKTRPEDLLIQLRQAAAGISLQGASWPAGAPTEAAVINLADALEADITLVSNIDGALGVARQARNNRTVTGRDLMEILDGFTDGMFGKEGAEKNTFGLPPKSGPSPAFTGPVDQVVVTRVQDGSAPNSIFVDFASIEAVGSYEAEWFTDADMTPATRVGSVVVTQSEFTTPSLTKGQQYWFRIRAIRANKPGPWSDPATRVAGL